MELVQAELEPGLRILGLQPRCLQVRLLRSDLTPPRSATEPRRRPGRARAGRGSARARPRRWRPRSRRGRAPCSPSAAPLGKPGVAIDAAAASASAAAATAASGRARTRAGRPAAARTPAGEQHRPGDRDEVPVVVDERVDEPERERDRERRRRISFDPFEPPERAYRRARGGGDESEEERQARRARCRRGPGAERCAAESPPTRSRDSASARPRRCLRRRLRAARHGRCPSASPHQAKRLFELRLETARGRS